MVVDQDPCTPPLHGNKQNLYYSVFLGPCALLGSRHWPLQDLKVDLELMYVNHRGIIPLSMIVLSLVLGAPLSVTHEVVSAGEWWTTQEAEIGGAGSCLLWDLTLSACDTGTMPSVYPPKMVERKEELGSRFCVTD